MSSSIGDIGFDIMHGLPANLKTRMDTWEVPGIDGYGAQAMGLGDARFSLITIVYCDDNDQANGVIADCEAMQGTMAAIVNDWGDEYDAILIEKVDTTDAKKPCIHEGNFDAVRVQITWQMCSTQVQV